MVVLRESNINAWPRLAVGGDGATLADCSSCGSLAEADVQKIIGLPLFQYFTPSFLEALALYMAASL